MSGRIRLRRGAAGSALFAALAFNGASFAASSVRVPVSCGSQAEFEHELLLRVGRGVPVPNVVLEITEESRGYVLRMRVGDEARTLRDVECRALLRAAVVVTAALTLSHAPTRPPQRRAQQEAPPGPGGARNDARDSTPQAARASDSKPEVRVALGVGVARGLLPGATVGAELFAESLWQRRFGAALALRYLTRKARQDDTGRGLVVDALGAQALGRYRWSSRGGIALGAAAFRLDANGLGAGRRSDHVWAAGPAAELSFEPLRLSGFWLEFAAEVRWSALRPTFEILNYGPIFTASPFDVSLFVRLGPRFH